MADKPKLTTTQFRLLELREQARKSHKEADEIRRSLEKTCHHPITTAWSWEHDTGYGEQRQHEGLQCTLCYARQYWPKLHGDRWIKYSDYLKALRSY